MIKINLLPVPKAKKIKKQAELRSQVFLLAVVLVFVGIICGTIWLGKNNQVKNLKLKKAQVDAELVVLLEKVKEVEGFEKNKKTLEEKNRIIEQLRKNQSGPVHVLDEISKSLEPLKLWLTKLDVKSKRVSLSGKALSNSDIVEFVNRMKSSKYFTNVVLIESKQAKSKGVSIYVFQLKSDVTL